MSIKAMKQSLELFEQFGRDSRLKYEHQAIYKIIVSLRQAIAEAEKQPTGPATSADRYFYEAGFEAGRQQGMKQERALWELARIGQEIEAEAEKQEPVAHWNFNQGFSHCMIDRLNEASKHNPAPVYTHPQPAQPKREWVGLTTDEVFELASTRLPLGLFAKLVEAKLREKNT